AMQVDIYERTVALEKQREEQGTLEGESQQELQRLATEQGQLADLLVEAVPADDAIDKTAPPAPSPELDNELDRALEKARVPGFGADK
ncbi:MAG: hypothetical protein ABI614_27455, partial [Planctomycetota bacterium]